MRGFLSEFSRDLINVLDILLGLLGVLAVLSWRQIIQFVRICAAQVVLARRLLSQAIVSAWPQLYASDSNHYKVGLVAGFLIVVLTATLVVTLLSPVWKWNSRVEPKSQSHMPCARLEYRLVAIEDSRGAGTLELSCNGQLIFKRDGYFLTLQAFDPEGNKSSVTLEYEQNESRGTIPAHDITDDGAPDVVLRTHSGGTCCGPEHELWSLRMDEITCLIRIEQTKYEEEAKFEDLDGDGIYEIQRDDVLFRDYGSHGSTAFATFPVILALKDGAYKLEPRFMRQSIPSEVELQRISQAVHAREDNEETRAVYRYLMQLTYGGNGYQAQRLVGLAVSEDERAFVWKEFKFMLSNSEYWSEVAAMNGWDAELSEFSGETCSF